MKDLSDKKNSKKRKGGGFDDGIDDDTETAVGVRKRLHGKQNKKKFRRK